MHLDPAPVVLEGLARTLWNQKHVELPLGNGFHFRARVRLDSQNSPMIVPLDACPSRAAVQIAKAQPVIFVKNELAACPRVHIERGRFADWLCGVLPNWMLRHA